MRDRALTHPHPLALVLGLTVLLAVPTRAVGQNAILALSNGTDHDVWSVNEALGSSQIVQESITFLPLELAGFNQHDRLRRDVPVESSGGPAPTVRLPGQASLCRVRQGASMHIMCIDSVGDVSVLVTASDGNPPGLLEHVAVRADGTCALAATSLVEGGDVLLLDLVSGAPPVNLTAGLQPLAIEGSSLRLGAQRAWFVADGALHRVDLAAPASPEAVSLALDPGDVLLPELATSNGGDWVAVVVEQPSGSRHIHVVSPAGVATRVTSVAGAYDSPGLEDPAGPFVVLSDDGEFVAWRQTVAAAREVFVERVLQPGAPSQLTADGQFVDTIDNAGILGFIGQVFVFVAGELPDGPGQIIGSADVFASDVSGGVPAQTVNVTGTSGEASPPFLQKGTLEIQQAVLDPLSERLLLVADPDDGNHAVLSVPLDGQPGLTTWISALASPPVLAAAGDHVLIAAELEPGPLDPPGSITQHVALLPPAGGPPGLLPLGTVTGSLPLIFDRFVQDATGARMAFVASLAPGFELPVLVDVSTATAATVWDQIMAVAPGLAFAPSGDLVVGVGLVDGPFLYAGFTAPFVGSLYPLPLAAGFPLGP